MTKEYYIGGNQIFVHQNDLPDHVDLGDIIAIDTETMGLCFERDRLCVVQLSSGDGSAHLVQIHKGQTEAPNLKKIIEDENTLKLFHFARFDIATLYKYLNILTKPVFCTKIASKMVRTYTDRHGLKNLTRDLIGVELSKQQQTSDWGAKDLNENQVQYAASDVLYLHKLHEQLVPLLAREGRTALAQACFDFLPTRSLLDLEGWPETDIFAHS